MAKVGSFKQAAFLVINRQLPQSAGIAKEPASLKSKRQTIPGFPLKPNNQGELKRDLFNMEISMEGKRMNPKLTPREIEALRALPEVDFIGQDIAHALGVQVSTARYYLMQAMEKLGKPTAAAAWYEAVKRGILSI